MGKAVDGFLHLGWPGIRPAINMSDYFFRPSKGVALYQQQKHWLLFQPMKSEQKVQYP